MSAGPVFRSLKRDSAQEMLLAARPWEATTINQLERTSSPVEAEEHLSSQ